MSSKDIEPDWVYEPEPKPELCAVCHSEVLITEADKQTGLCPDCRSSERSARAVRECFSQEELDEAEERRRLRIVHAEYYDAR